MRSGLLCHSCNLQSPRSRRARSVLLEEFRQLVEEIFKSIGYNFFVGTFVALNLGITLAALKNKLENNIADNRELNFRHTRHPLHISAVKTTDKPQRLNRCLVCILLPS